MPLSFRPPIVCLQEFVELVRAGQQLEAIAYARRHLAPWAPQHMPELQRAAALLAFQAGTQCAPYRQLLDDARVGGAGRELELAAWFVNNIPARCTAAGRPPVSSDWLADGWVAVG